MQNRNTPVMEIQNYRIVETPKGKYRLQYKIKRSFFEFMLRKNPWRTICIDFPHLHRLKAKLYFYTHKDLK